MPFKRLCLLVFVFALSNVDAGSGLSLIPQAEAKVTCRSLGLVWNKQTRSCEKGTPGYKGKKQKNAPGCTDFPRPALCSGIKAKTSIYVVPQICQTLKDNPKCFATIGYRSCKTNSSIRGASRKSAHLCGKAVDIRLNTCKIGQYHGRGSAKHRHYEIGSCF